MAYQMDSYPASDRPATSSGTAPPTCPSAPPPPSTWNRNCNKTHKNHIHLEIRFRQLILANMTSNTANPHHLLLSIIWQYLRGSWIIPTSYASLKATMTVTKTST